MEGKVKFFDAEKRFGFIAGNDDKEYFVHESGLNEGVRISEDDVVSFDVEEGDRGPKAVNVKKGSAESESSNSESETNESSSDEVEDSQDF